MASGSTVLSVGSVQITANGGQTGDLLAAIIKASQGATTVASSSSPTLPAPPKGSGPFELVIGPNFTAPSNGVISLPSGYEFVVYAGSDTLSGGSSNSAIVGTNMSYTGGADTVLGAGGAGNVVDAANDAIMAFSGAYTVTANGTGDTIGINAGSGVDLNADGAGDTFNLGGGASSTVSLANTAATGTSTEATVNATGNDDTFNVAAGVSDLLFLTASATVNAAAGSSTVVTGPDGHVTLNATSGNQLVFDNAGNNLINAGLSTEYVTGINVPASSYNASAGGADTIFASTAIDYSNVHGTANSLFFLGGAGAVTVSAAAAETVFGGAGGGSYSVGATSFDFIGGGGADTLTGGSGDASVFAWGGTNENLMIDQAAGTMGNTLISFGNNDSINASLAAGGNDWQIVNQTLPASAGGTFTGDSTLVGSSAGNDLFVVYIDPTASSLPPAHTIDIANWQSSDTMFLSDLGNSSQALDAADASAVQAFDGGTSHTLTLSDGTTIDFTGARPNTIAHV